MFTGIVEELGTSRRSSHRRRSAPARSRRAGLGARGGRLGRRRRRLPDRHGRRTGSFERRRDEPDARADHARRARAPATRSTSSWRCAPADRLGGHIVQGHVDGVGDGRAPSADGFAQAGASRGCRTSCCRYLVERGSIAVDGRQPDRRRARRRRLEVSLIPETLERTTLGRAARRTGSTSSAMWSPATSSAF